MRSTLLILAILLALPTASAGPVSEAVVDAVRDGYDAACTEGPAPGPVCDNVAQMFDSVGGGVPLVTLVNETASLVCADPDSHACRQVSGRPGLPPSFDVCAPEPWPDALIPRLLWHAVNGGEFRYYLLVVEGLIHFGSGADPLVAGTTSERLAGTPLEGESLCHDHWDTMRAVAYLV